MTEPSELSSQLTPRETHRVPCSHCGLDVPRGLIDKGAELQFCCAGCRTVYQVIHSCGLDRFYRLKEREADLKVPARTTDRRYGELDDEAFRVNCTTEVAPGVRSVELYLEGVHCAACVWLVEKLPRVLPGVIEARLDLRRALVRVVWEEDTVQLSRIARGLDSLGYPPHPARDSHRREARIREDRRFLVRLGVAGACAGNVMLLAFALYGGAFTGPEAGYGAFFRWTSLLIAMVSLAGPGNIFFRGAWAALKTRTAHLDLPIALGLAVGAVAGAVHTILGRGEVYFDSLTVLVFLLLVGRWIQHRQQRWASDSLELLFSLTPSFARRVEPGKPSREVPIEALEAGQVVEVHPGESLPADGLVLEGVSTLDQSLLTGESCPIPVVPGESVCAGAVNISGVVQVRVQAAGRETRVGRLMQVVEEYSQRKAPIVSRADRLAGWFVLAVILLAVLTFGIWLAIDPSRAVDSAAALLIVTCPCALGLATPLAVAVAIGRAARRGILIKGGDALETLSRPGRVLLDKTGTITEGSMTLVEWNGDEQVRSWVAALEAASTHPISRALAPRGRTADRAAPREVVHVPGAGIEGLVADHQVAVGSPGYIRERVGEEPAWALEAHDHVVSRALTPVWVAVDGALAAVAGVGNPIRRDAVAFVSGLRELGWRPAILSGDDPNVVKAVARAIGIPWDSAHGGLTPEDKVRYVEAEGCWGTVVMVGDGVNDAAALSAATVGIAVHGGAEASLAAADIYLGRPGLEPIIELVKGSARTLRTIHRCLGISLVYNAVAAGLALGGMISPLVAAILMPLSSFTVLTLAWSAKTFGTGQKDTKPRLTGAP